MNRYAAFLEVVDTGSFSQAARRLNYTQGAVSQMVQTLEKELSAVLLIRDRHGVQLTDDGQAYLPYIRSVCNALHELEEKRLEMQGLGSSLIRIGTFTSVSHNWLPGWMKQFKTRYPAVQFVLQQGEYTTIAQWIKSGQVDFGFVNPAQVEGLTMQPLKNDVMLAVLPPAHPLSAAEAVPLASLAGEPFILLDEGEYSVPLEAFETAGLTPHIAYKVYDDYTIMAMVAQGLGVSMLYDMVVSASHEPLLTRPVEPKIARTIAVAYRNRDTMPIAARYFLDFILTHPPQYTQNAPGKCRARLLTLLQLPASSQPFPEPQPMPHRRESPPPVSATGPRPAGHRPPFQPESQRPLPPPLPWQKHNP